MFKYKIPLAIAVAAASLLISTLASADDAALVTEIADTFYKIYGTHSGFRVNHAKGVVGNSSFVATPPPPPLPPPALFLPSTLPLLGRSPTTTASPTLPSVPPAIP